MVEKIIGAAVRGDGVDRDGDETSDIGGRGVGRITVVSRLGNVGGGSIRGAMRDSEDVGDPLRVRRDNGVLVESWNDGFRSGDSLSGVGRADEAYDGGMGKPVGPVEIGVTGDDACDDVVVIWSSSRS